MSRSRRISLIAIVLLTVTACAWWQKESGEKETKAIPYLKLSTPQHVLATAQPWEGNEFPHTMSVLEMKTRRMPLLGLVRLERGAGHRSGPQ
ncbi:MAG TPA: hypothetical protein VNO32_41695 [Candidatus Acidoferrum sp.]|nr:hypothetical protein [Candidatus Acidoferrum sp.]